jgi:hypothetical protein
MNQNFWIAFEEDTDKETRLAMGAEGPDEITDRTAQTVRAIARYAAAHHQANPDRRLIVWATTHYDTISPFVKRDVLGVGKEQPLPVNYGAGITIDIDKTGRATSRIGGREYVILLSSPNA